MSNISANCIFQDMGDETLLFINIFKSYFLSSLYTFVQLFGFLHTKYVPLFISYKKNGSHLRLAPHLYRCMS